MKTITIVQFLKASGVYVGQSADGSWSVEYDQCPEETAFGFETQADAIRYAVSSMTDEQLLSECIDKSDR